MPVLYILAKEKKVLLRPRLIQSYWYIAAFDHITYAITMDISFTILTWIVTKSTLSICTMAKNQFKDIKLPYKLLCCSRILY